ncbi:hypothetical protein [Streptomyces sp. bgisy034]
MTGLLELTDGGSHRACLDLTSGMQAIHAASVVSSGGGRPGRP